jgi:hypothetical protein
MKTVAEKMGIKPGMRAILVQAPEGVAQTIRLPGLDLAPTLAEDFDYIHFFARSRADLREHFPGLKSHLRPTGMLWVSWPKAGQHGPFAARRDRDRLRPRAGRKQNPGH